MWNGDPAYWKGRAPNLFPYVGRLTNDCYTYGGPVLHGVEDHQRIVLQHIGDIEVERKGIDFPALLRIGNAQILSAPSPSPPGRGAGD